MNKATTIPEAMIAGIEFYLMNGEIQFIQDGVQRLFHELDVKVAAKIRQEMDDDPKALKGLEILGITDPIEQLKQFIYCRFGDFTKRADITIGNVFNYEYWDCGNKPCPADGLLCKLPQADYGNLTLHEAEILKEIAHDNSNKIIAHHLHRSKFTVDTQVKHLTRKIGCFTKAGLASFAGQHNLL